MQNNQEFDLVKEELTHRMASITKERKAPYAKAKGLEKLTELEKKLRNTKNFTDEIVGTLNQILEERNITFQKGQKDAFIAYMKPTIIQLTQEYIKP